MMSGMDRPLRAALALGSGGARGYAHIGVIEVLEERGVEIVEIAGSSMGALVGGLHAAGKLEQYTEWITTLTELQLLRLMDVSPRATGMMRAEKVFARMRELLEGALIEQLPVPFTAVATDLLARRAVWFQRGPVETAVRASVAIPGVFTPVVLNGRVLVDGGLMDPVPVAPTMSARADVIIAVDLGGARAGAHAQDLEGAPAKDSAEERPVEQWADRFRRRASDLFGQEGVRSLLRGVRVAPRHDDGTAFNEEPGQDLTGFDVMNLSLEAMQGLLTRYRLAGSSADLVITVSKDACRSFEFHRATEMIALGRTLAIDALEHSALVPGTRSPSSP
jgi:NTE family protein